MRLAHLKEESGAEDESVTACLVFFLERPHMFLGIHRALDVKDGELDEAVARAFLGVPFPCGDGTDTSVSVGAIKENGGPYPTEKWGPASH